MICLSECRLRRRRWLMSSWCIRSGAPDRHPGGEPAPTRGEPVHTAVWPSGGDPLMSTRQKTNPADRLRNRANRADSSSMPTHDEIPAWEKRGERPPWERAEDAERRRLIEQRRARFRAQARREGPAARPFERAAAAVGRLNRDLEAQALDRVPMRAAVGERRGQRDLAGRELAVVDGGERMRAPRRPNRPDVPRAGDRDGADVSLR